MTKFSSLSRLAAASFVVLAYAAAPALAQKTGDGPATTPDTQPTGTGGFFFGDDTGAFTNDGECDDRRFAGPGMAAFLTWENAGRDATDCQQLLAAGQVSIWDYAASVAATQCSAVDFGDDSGDYPADNECDDIRFEGRGMASFVTGELIRHDASDCRRFCELGLIGLRDY